jgi:hypothetical protein
MWNLFWPSPLSGHQRGSVSETAEKIGIPEQILHEACIKFYDDIDALEVQLGENEKLSRATEAEIEREVLAAANYAPEHFKIFD